MSGTGEHQAATSRIALLDTAWNEDNTWEKLAPRYGVTNPDPALGSARPSTVGRLGLSSSFWPWHTSCSAEGC